MYWHLAPAAQANEANVKKQARIYYSLDLVTVEVKGKIPFEFNRPQETNHLPNEHRSGMQQQHNILE